MKLALLGEHADLAPILAAVLSSGRHSIRWAACVSDATAAAARTAERLSRWEALLSIDQLEAVLVVGAQEETQQAARQLAAQQIPLILVPATAMGSAFLYELSLIRDDMRVPLFPFFPSRRHRLVSEIQHALHARTWGKPLQISFERQTPGGPRVELAECNHRLLWDLDLLRQIGGAYNQITAFRAGAEFASVISESVTFAGPSIPESSWTITGSDAATWTLTVRCERGELRLTGRDGMILDALRTPASTLDGDNDDLATAICDELDQIESTIEGRTLDDGWSELVREMESVEATHQSIRRRRTIDLLHEPTSERNLFKTQMSALGCGVLMFTLLLVVLVLIIGQAFDLGDTAMKLLRALCFAPLFLYLLLQFLMILTRPSADERVGESPISQRPDAND